MRRSRSAARSKVWPPGSPPSAAWRKRDLEELKHCLPASMSSCSQRGVTVDSFSAYVELNEQFHRIIVDLADSAVLSRQIARAVTLPFASASAFVMVQARLPEAQTMFTVAQDHHRCIVRAIEAREGQRAETLMREHARLARRNLELALRNQQTRSLVPGSNLITFRSRAARRKLIRHNNKLREDRNEIAFTERGRRDGAGALRCPRRAAQDKPVQLQVLALGAADASHARRRRCLGRLHRQGFERLDQDHDLSRPTARARRSITTIWRRDGIADISHVNPGYEPGRFPIIGAAELPFIFSNAKEGSAALDAWYRRYAEQEMKDVRYCLPSRTTRARCTSPRRRRSCRPTCPGSKVRPPNAVIANWMTLLGATNVQASAPEIRDMLEKGVADAAGSPWGSMLLFGIDKVTKYHIDSPLYVSEQVWVLNKAKYDSLSPAQKKVMDQHCSSDWALKIAAPWADFESGGRDKIKAMPGQEVYPLSPTSSPPGGSLPNRWSPIGKLRSAKPARIRVRSSRICARPSPTTSRAISAGTSDLHRARGRARGAIVYRSPKERAVVRVVHPRRPPLISRDLRDEAKRAAHLDDACGQPDPPQGVAGCRQGPRRHAPRRP